MKALPPSFFARDTVIVAKDLLGKVIAVNGVRGRIIETEAYKQDKASHAYKRTERSALMFDTYGHVYVYLIYGMYYCLNFTTEKEGVGAVLIRAVTPLAEEKNASGVGRSIGTGPGKLSLLFGITKEQFNGTKIGDKLKVLDDGYTVAKIIVTPRIGITQDTHLLWRFVVNNA